MKQLLDQLEVCEESTRRAEKKLDRERSRTVRELDAQGQGPSQSVPTVIDPPPPPPTGDDRLGIATSNGEKLNGTSVNAAEPLNGTTATNTNTSVPDPLDAELEEIRNRELEMLKDELLHRAHDIDLLQWKV